MRSYTLDELRALPPKDKDDRAFAADPAFHQALRDLYFDVSAGLLGPDGPDLLGSLMIYCRAPLHRAGAARVTSCPTSSHTLLRYVAATDIAEAVRDLFARPVPGMPGLAAVFIDPSDLGYANFENILPLDVLFEGVPARLALVDRQPIGDLPDAWTFRIEAPAELRAVLEGLGTLGPHVSPLDLDARSGKRLIFHAAALSEAIGDAARAALPAAALEGFSHANVVLRCNRFTPDAQMGFAPHFDTPYSDHAVQQISKFTVLLYVTGGTGAPALQLGEHAIADIAPMTAIVFHHRHRHASQPYRDGVKVFYRTELVYEVDVLGFDPEVARRFAQACYLVGYSRGRPRVAARMRAMFEAVAAARWGLPAGAPEPVWFRKTHTSSMTFLCNGHDYWFRDGSDPRVCAVAALLDYFNAEAPRYIQFRWMCEEETILEPEDGTAWIVGQLREGQPVATPLSLAQLLELPEEADRLAPCCPSHHRAAFRPRRSPDVIERYLEYQDEAREKVLGAPVLVLGTDVFFVPERIVVGERHIYLLAEESLGRVNFAGGWSPPCWHTHTPGEFIETEAHIQGLVLMVPPIEYERIDGCLHLMLDYFRSGWLSSWGCTDDIEIPRIVR